MRRLEDDDITNNSVLAGSLECWTTLIAGVEDIRLGRRFYGKKCLTLLKVHNYANGIPTFVS